MGTMTVKKYAHDGGKITLSFGKIAYQNPKRRANLAEVTWGWSKLEGNKEPYFSVTGSIWNHIGTDIVTGGCSVQKTIARFIHGNDILKKIVDLGEKYHLMNYSAVPKEAKDEINSLLEGLVKEHNVQNFKKWEE
jgi:hypothetical protein